MGRGVARALAALIPVFCDAQTLQLAGVTVHQYDGGPPMPSAYAFTPRDIAFFSFQVRGARKANDRLKITCRIQSFDPEGAALAPAVTRKTDAELAQEDRAWVPKFSYDVPIPPSALSGAYHVAIEVADELAQTSVKLRIDFNVKGRDVAPSETLAIRNPRFLRREEDETALAEPAYRVSDAVWARFEITGFRRSAKNEIGVEYDVRLENPDGKVIFEQPNAAAEKNSAFYPIRWVPGVVSLNFKPGTRTGRYTIVVVLRDLVGNQTSEARLPFSLE